MEKALIVLTDEPYEIKVVIIYGETRHTSPPDYRPGPKVMSVALQEVLKERGIVSLITLSEVNNEEDSSSVTMLVQFYPESMSSGKDIQAAINRKAKVLSGAIMTLKSSEFAVMIDDGSSKPFDI